jgi:putative membrane protein
MRRLAGSMLALLGALAASACIQDRTAVTDCNDFVMTPSEDMEQYAGRPAQQTQQELDFTCHAAMYGRAQIAYARLAEQQSASPAVKAFAATVLQTQKRLDERLSRIAIERVGVTPPRSLDAAHQALHEQLARLSGNAFDRAYLENSIADGEAAIALFRKGASGVDPLMGQFAHRAVPGLEERVSHAQSALQQVGS